MFQGIPSMMVAGAGVAVTGPGPSWVDSVDPATTDTDAIHRDSSYVHQVNITLSAGTVQKLRVYIKSCDFDGTPWKVALYDNSQVPLVSSTLSLNIADGGAWKEVTVTDTVISSGTYSVCFDGQAGGTTEILYRYKNGTGVTHENDQGCHGGYIAFPNNPMVDNCGGSFDLGGACAVGVY